MERACEVYFNPSCSKCQKVRTLLEGEGVAPTYREYLTVAPTREELERLMVLLRTDDPRAMMRTGERLYEELELASASRDALLDYCSGKGDEDGRDTHRPRMSAASSLRVSSGTAEARP